MRWFLLLLLIQGVPASAQKTASQSLKEAKEINQTGERAAARRAIEQTIELAVQEKDQEVEAEARYHFATGLTQDALYDLSDLQLRAALALFKQSGNQRRQANTHSQLGQNAYGTGNTVKARDDFDQAMKLYEAIGDELAVATEHLNLAFVTDGPQ
jgi:hypothetical protein